MSKLKVIKLKSDGTNIILFVSIRDIYTSILHMRLTNFSNFRSAPISTFSFYHFTADFAHNSKIFGDICLANHPVTQSVMRFAIS